MCSSSPPCSARGQPPAPAPSPSKPGSSPSAVGFWTPFSWVSRWVQSQYELRVLPTVVDRVCGREVFTRKRLKVVPQAFGRVLEVGFGSGHNLPAYDWPRVAALVGVDPSAASLAIARRRLDEGLEAAESFVKAAKGKVELVEGSAECMPMLADQSFDCVVVGFSLCTIPDVRRALQECRRVLKDGREGGLLLFAEHGLAPEDDPRTRAWQRRLTPYWKTFTGGCNLDRDMEALIREAGFEFKSLEKKFSKGPKVASFFYTGVASKL
uniref:Methyltransferase type 11 domain-containing protein n=1 Tax=Chloropicon laureae TaxID=464258 RepID=A0A7S3E1E5_9CHLO|mmetsp:Transcript_13099/g.33877  ORF Transcript_13099/g.33877 Transcript_13099/m.33877 type:complete len:267 (+) Transcript_13099:45-845(+)